MPLAHAHRLIVKGIYVILVWVLLMALAKEVIDIAEELYIHSNYGNYSKVRKRDF